MVPSTGCPEEAVCPRHPHYLPSSRRHLEKNLDYLLQKYDLWSRYEPEDRTVTIFYASMYGDTENVVNILASSLAEAGIKNITAYDVSSTHVSTLIAEAFRCSHLIFAAPTYNNGIYPAMLNLLTDMKALNLQNRTVALIENGSWALPVPARCVKSWKA